MSSIVARPMLRQSGAWSRMAARRFESTATTKGTQAAAKESTAQAAKQTSEAAKQSTQAAKQTGQAAKETTAQAAKETTQAAKETTNQAASKAKETTSQAASKAQESLSKAQEGLSKVTSSAGPAIAGAAQGVAKSLSKVGGRTARVVNFVERQVPLVVYYSKVGAEVAKIVFRSQKMSPPSISTFQTYFQNAMKNPSILLQTASQTASQAAQQSGNIVSRLQNLSRGQILAGGVVAAECLGFFTVGEMIGRFKIVGYHGETESAHH
ncbi:mitochondrial ATP synthase g subunit-domain-containing protein [Poronia punctata]|nr:mitochondrial ATP synthase g subunit-domain-containing protein [Poronia punctata]